MIYSHLIQRWTQNKKKGSPSNLKKWTIPTTNYSYKKISFKTKLNFLGELELLNEDQKGYKMARASIIPYVIVNDENYWMLGSFADYTSTGEPILTDFGGRQEYMNENALQCALRELKEESKGLLSSVVKKNLNDKKRVTVYEGVNEKKKEKVYFFIVNVEYKDVREIPKTFDRLAPITKEKLGPINFYSENFICCRDLRTSKNLTDFVSYLNNYRY